MRFNAKLSIMAQGLRKTTNLQYIYGQTIEDIKGKMVSIRYQRRSTLFLIFVFEFRENQRIWYWVQLYTVPGQSIMTRRENWFWRGGRSRLCRDSLKVQRKKNIESLINLAKNWRRKELVLGVSRLLFNIITRFRRDRFRDPPRWYSGERSQFDVESASFSASALKGTGVFELWEKLVN